MPTYKKVYLWKDLPAKPPKEIAETLTLDFKGQHKKDSGEMAKDMAAFANTHGGVILIGVAETADNYERSLLTKAEAKQVAKDYEDGARDLLAPRPHVDPAVVEFPGDTEKALVAINVEPFPGQLIGALLPGTEAWRFPVRTATRHTKCLDPEKAMIYADPKARKAAILLAQIPLLKSIYVQVRVQHVTGLVINENVQRLEAHVQSLDVEKNSVDLRVMRPDRVAMVECVCPLEDIDAVWQVHGAVWVVRVNGAMYFHRPGSNAELTVGFTSGVK